MKQVAASALAAVAVALNLMLAPMGAHAELSATSVTGDSRLVDFEYDEDNVYLVITRPKRSTFLRFGTDERITYVSAGDQKNFEFPVAKSFEFMEVKPKFENMETNLTVVTTKRTYHLIVRSTYEGGKWYARVTWKYPQLALVDLTRNDALQDQIAEAGSAARPQNAQVAGPRPLASQSEAEIEASTIERLNFDYAITGDAAFRPVRVMDDGTFTFVTLPPKVQELPAVFRSEPDDPSKMALVNYEVKSGSLVIQRLMDSFVLKLGKEEVKVERKKRGFWSTSEGRH